MGKDDRPNNESKIDLVPDRGYVRVDYANKSFLPTREDWRTYDQTAVVHHAYDPFTRAIESPYQSYPPQIMSFIPGPAGTIDIPPLFRIFPRTVAAEPRNGLQNLDETIAATGQNLTVRYKRQAQQIKEQTTVIGKRSESDLQEAPLALKASEDEPTLSMPLHMRDFPNSSAPFEGLTPQGGQFEGLQPPGPLAVETESRRTSKPLAPVASEAAKQILEQAKEIVEYGPPLAEPAPWLFEPESERTSRTRAQEKTTRQVPSDADMNVYLANIFKQQKKGGRALSAAVAAVLPDDPSAARELLSVLNPTRHKGRKGQTDLHAPSNWEEVKERLRGKGMNKTIEAIEDAAQPIVKVTGLYAKGFPSQEQLDIQRALETRANDQANPNRTEDIRHLNAIKTAQAQARKELKELLSGMLVQKFGDKLGNKVFVVDAGHGGTDTGAAVTTDAGQELTERDLTPRVAEATVLFLRGLNVSAAISTTERKGLREKRAESRSDDIRAMHPEVVVSLHYNKIEKPQKIPAETYINASSGDGQRLAQFAGNLVSKLLGVRAREPKDQSQSPRHELGMINGPGTEATAVLEICNLNNSDCRRGAQDPDFVESIAAAVGTALVLSSLKTPKKYTERQVVVQPTNDRRIAHR
jgi:N-acetylmuramoyl-L-alanine amidase